MINIINGLIVHSCGPACIYYGLLCVSQLEEHFDYMQHDVWLYGVEVN